jgi:photosynthetic reaction center cytochrome c subunit
MKRGRPKFILIASTCAAVVVVVSGARLSKSRDRQDWSVMLSTVRFASRTEAHATAAATPEQTVEQCAENTNIKVLMGMPESQLLYTMESFETALGVPCTYCHLKKDGQVDLAADDKKAKLTARSMIKMVLELNKNTFRGEPAVSCYSCHHGQVLPQGFAALPLPPLPPRPLPGVSSVAAASPSLTPSLPTADDLFNKYIAALGGEQGIERLKSRIARGTILQPNGITGTFELYQEAPDRFYQTITTPQATTERGFNGKVGWQKNARGLVELSGLTLGDLADYREANSLFSLIRLKERLTNIRVSGKDKIDEREVYVLSGTTTDGGSERLFFDVETGLLRRRMIYISTMLGVIPRQIDVGDYREIGGIKFPFLWQLNTINFGAAVTVRRFTDMVLNTPVDASKFDMPSNKASRPVP